MIAPVELTKELIRFDSISRNSNVPVSDHLHDQLDRLGFTIERIPYQDEDGIEKVSLVGRKGEGNGGLALLGHSDTVPVDGWEEDPFEAVVRQDKLYGRGSCDMKGSLACMLAAAESFSSTHLLAPLYIVFTADEEVGCQGAKEVLARSELFNEFDLKYGCEVYMIL